MTNSFKRFLALRLALAAAFIVGLAVSAAQADHHEMDEEKVAKPFVVKIHADWCGTCTKLNPTWMQIEKELGDQAQLVVFDVTDKATLDRSRAEANRLGLTEFFDSYKSKTGTIAVIDGSTHEPVSVMRGELDFAKYAAAVAEARGS